DASDLVARTRRIEIRSEAVRGVVRRVVEGRPPRRVEPEPLEAEHGMQAADSGASRAEILVEREPGPVHAAPVVRLERASEVEQRLPGTVLVLLTHRVVVEAGGVLRVEGFSEVELGLAEVVAARLVVELGDV